MVVAFRKSLAQAADDSVDSHDGAALQERSQQYHVVCLGVLHLQHGTHGVDGYHTDIGACRQAVYAVGVVDKRSAGFHAALEFVEALLVENHGGIEAVEHGGADGLVAEDYCHICRAATLFGTVGWHPRHFEIVH